MTFIGYILVPIGLLAFAFSRKWLYRLLVFSLPFSATAIFNLGSGESASGIQVWMFLGALWLLRGVGAWLLRGNVIIDGRIRRVSAYLLLFVLVAAISLVMPIYINGSLAIASPLLLDDSTTPLFLSAKHFTALMYLLFGALICLSIAHENIEPDQFARSERIFFASGAFVAIWGIFQVLCFHFHITYPAFLFNNNASPYAQAYEKVIPEIGVMRVSSVAVEPSMLAQALLTIAPLGVPALLRRGGVFSVRMDRICFALIVCALLLSASSVGFAGLLLLFAGAALSSVRMKGGSARAAVLAVVRWIVAIAVLSATAFYTFPAARGVIEAQLLNKSEGYSALERLRTISLAWDYFTQYPVFGVGWGSVTSHDLVFKLLANVGLVGFILFLVLTCTLSLTLFRKIREQVKRPSVQQIVWLLSFALLMFSNLISEFAYVFGYFWFVLGMAMAASGKAPVIENEAHEALALDGQRKTA